MKDMKPAIERLSPTSNAPGPRIARERATIRSMVQLFCTDHHAPGAGLCRECEDLLGYALKRLETCPFQEKKPACNRCTVHCYSATQRDRVKTVMRYAGPRMLLRHPIQGLRHLIDIFGPIPELAMRKRN
jgi:hypothetical protein